MANSVLPQELKDAGWKLGRKVVNDDEEHPVFNVHNEKLKQGTGDYKTVDEAVRAAVLLQLRSEGQKIAGQRAVTKRLKEMKAKQESGVRGQRSEENVKLETRDLKLSEIRIDGGTQPRELNDATVLEYFDAMIDGAKFPPVDVFFDGKSYWLADGFHRFFATKKTSLGKHSGGPTIAAVIHQGTKRDAILFSIGANAAHGLPRSNEDKRRAVLTLLEDPEWKKNSDSWIAEAAHVSQPFVSAIRREIAKPADATPTPRREKIERAAGTKDLKRFESASTKRTTKAGRTIDTKAIGKKAVPMTGSKVPAPAPTNGHASVALPDDVPVIINLTVHPGKAPKRKVTIAARAGESKPVFRTDFTAADLEPMPCALREIYAALAKGAKGKGKAQRAK